MYYKGFDSVGFLEWMENEVSLDAYAKALISNIIEYAVNEKNCSKDQLAEFLSDMLPTIEFLEVARFCEDSILTDTTLRDLHRKAN